MKFSIREMLAMTFLVVLAMLAWRMAQQAQRDQVRLVQLRSEVETLQSVVRLDEPVLHQAILHTRDEFAALHALRERAVEQFELLREKYSTMEPPMPGELAIRSIPSLRIGPGTAPAVYGVWVSDQREAWLKFAVHLGDQGRHASGDPEQQHELLRRSPFELSGPYELRLPPGRQTLVISHGPAADGAVPVELTLDDKVLLRTRFVAPGNVGSGGSWTSPRTQANYAPQQPLPWLLTGQLSGATEPDGNPDEEYAFSVWLSDHSSGFEGFPVDE